MVSYKVTQKHIPRPSIEVELSAELMNQLGLLDFVYVKVSNSQGKQVIGIATTSKNGSFPDGDVRVSKGLKRELGENIEEVFIEKLDYEKVFIGVSRIDEMNKGVVYAAPELIERFSEQVEIVNAQTGARMSLQLVADDGKLGSNSIRLNRYQRLLLDAEKAGAVLFVHKPAHGSEGDLRQNRVRKVIHACFENIGKVFVGSRSLKLRLGYLYMFDDTQSIARVHPNTRKFLGMEENDKIVLQYRGQQVVLPLLDLDVDHMDGIVIHSGNDEQEIFHNSHLYIGIPAEIRAQLKVPNIHTIVEVRRSKMHLLFKHVNKLILPFLALWFALLPLFKDIESNLPWIMAVIVALTPLIIFASLSEERAKIK